ncbi:hypothetical protein SODALDRAFT_332514 [Sodiomyces alkalinus F11]|uniref:Endonuclease/exonuclease/phosphatase domain-containing protein n=1 Tax=Sodiomyces alkalinus (strain CBS 110278 / VKM F-3762 / F11) TaxID=1314773 RepID=A0A3N2PX34_SODAK|nr:hypothetical protein SODALDRAFT_332514 [Sodiomyces alkalinus F11]ROT39081.1 hypothetical protein SODALDRAFT_332514 [Sodiomyces alkalinus F11]
MATLLRDPRIDNYDILAIQEPWKNPFNDTTHHPVKDRFHLCYPTNGIARPAAVPPIPITPTPGTRIHPRTKRPPGPAKQAHSSRESHQIHRTNRDPWAIQDRVPTQTKLSTGGRL